MIKKKFFVSVLCGAVLLAGCTTVTNTGDGGSMPETTAPSYTPEREFDKAKWLQTDATRLAEITDSSTTREAVLAAVHNYWADIVSYNLQTQDEVNLIEASVRGAGTTQLEKLLGNKILPDEAEKPDFAQIHGLPQDKVLKALEGMRQYHPATPQDTSDVLSLPPHQRLLAMTAIMNKKTSMGYHKAKLKNTAGEVTVEVHPEQFIIREHDAIIPPSAYSMAGGEDAKALTKTPLRAYVRDGFVVIDTLNSAFISLSPTLSLEATFLQADSFSADHVAQLVDKALAETSEFIGVGTK